MRNALIAVIVVAVVALIFWAATRNPAGPAAATPAAAPPPRDELAGAPRIPLAEAAEKIQHGSVTVIDVRDADSYIASHIPGALQIPLARVEGEIGYLPRGKPIVTYCT